MNNWAHGALEKLNSCPVCDASTSNAVHYSRRDDNLNFPDTWHMHKCKSCRSIYLNPRPDDKSLPLAYQNYYTHDLPIDKTLVGEGFIYRLIGDYLLFRFNFKAKKALALIYSGGKKDSLKYSSGCALLIDINKLPGSILDEDFFFYGEDVELALRAKGLGLEATECHEAHIYHEGSGSARRGSLFYEYHINRGHWLLAKKLSNTTA